ncbi:MAG TPA: NADPH:quinone oxidoreductase family protein [Sphingobium sp.]|nr:NADPH:quinone oxidoreductase family protein [Sphingobium sp.]
MKTLLSHEPGPPESLVLEDIRPAEPGDGEICIAVTACGVNFPDLLMVADRYQFRPPRPFAPGAEVAGIVARVGPNVSGFAPGDRVMAICSWGGMAEELVVHQSKCFAVPDFLPLAEAAAFQMTYGTAWHALVTAGRLVAGETVLVLGASGGVGMAAVEIATALGAQVIAAVSTEEKAAIAMERGAKSAIIYSRGPLDRDQRRALGAEIRKAGGGGPHLVIDPVGGDYTEAAVRGIRRGGRLAVVGFTAGIASIPMNLVLLNEATIVPAAWGAVVAHDPDGFRQTISDLLRLYEGGGIRPYISRRFSLEDGAAALRSLGDRATIGKTVVDVTPEKGEPE